MNALIHSDTINHLQDIVWHKLFSNTMICLQDMYTEEISSKSCEHRINI